jgi:hypothetical protein
LKCGYVRSDGHAPIDLAQPNSPREKAANRTAFQFSSWREFV